MAQSIIAKKYAEAFLNVFIDELSEETMEYVCSLGNFISKNHLLISFLQWPVISHDIKIKALRDIVKKCKENTFFYKLIELLDQHKRLYMIGDVFKHICTLYALRKNIIHFTIHSSHELTSKELTVIKQFLANITSASIIYDYKVDKNLIAGIRLQSNTHLWQYSIRKQLNMMKLPLIR